MYKEENELDPAKAKEQIIVLNDNYIRSGKNVEVQDLFSLLECVQNSSKNEDQTELSKKLEELIVYCQHTHIARQECFHSLDFFNFLIFIFLNKHKFIQLQVLNILNTVIPDMNPDSEQILQIISSDFLQILQGLFNTEENEHLYNVIIKFISIVSSLSENYHQNIVNIIDFDRIFHKIQSENHNDIRIHVGLLENLLIYKLDTSIYSKIMDIALNQSNIIPIIIGCINIIVKRHPNEVFTTKLHFKIMFFLHDLLVNEIEILPFLDYFSLYLDFTENEISEPPVFLCTLLLSSSKATCHSAAVLLVRLIETSPPIISFLLKGKLLQNISEIIYHNKLTQKIDAVHVLTSLVTCSAMDVVHKIIITNVEGNNLIKIITSHISPDTLDYSPIIIDFLHATFHRIMGTELLNFFISNFFEGEGKDNCEDLLDELDEYNDPNYVTGQKVSELLDYIHSLTNKSDDNDVDNEEFAKHSANQLMHSDDNEDYGYSDPEDHQQERLNQLHELREMKQNKMLEQQHIDENIEVSDDYEEDSGLW